MFSKSRNEPQAKPMRAATADGTLTIIAADVEIVGNIRSTGDLHIDGKVDGDVVCRTLIQGQSGQLQGTIEADEATIRGLVEGSVRARSVTLEQTARISGDIVHESISIQAGAKVAGRFNHQDDIHAAPAEPIETPPALGDGSTSGERTLKAVASEKSVRL